MSHYTKEELERYLNKEMSFLGRINCTEHLKNCPECLALLKEIQDDKVFLENLRESQKLTAQYTPEPEATSSSH